MTPLNFDNIIHENYNINILFCNTYCIRLLNIYLVPLIFYNKTRGIFIMKDFKPIKQEKSVISIRIENKILKIVDEQSTKIDISRNEFIIQCIEYAIEHLKNN